VTKVRVDVRLRGWLAGRLPGGRATVEVPSGTTAAGVLDALGIPAGACVYVIDGEVAKYDTPVLDGDNLEVAFMAAGG
jgi:sulfur carrier protein ThiS